MVKLNKAVQILILFCLVGWQFKVLADTPDPLWEKTIAQHQLTKKWAAKDVYLMLIENKGDVYKTQIITSRFEAWDGNRAKYKVVNSIKEVESTTIKNYFDFTKMTETLESDFFQKNSKVKRTDNINIDNKICVKYEMNNVTGKFVAYVDPLNGSLLQQRMDFILPKGLEGYIKTNFLAHGNMSLPQSILTEYENKVPLIKTKMLKQETFTNWIKHE